MAPVVVCIQIKLGDLPVKMTQSVVTNNIIMITKYIIMVMVMIIKMNE